MKTLLKSASLALAVTCSAANAYTGKIDSIELSQIASLGSGHSTNKIFAQVNVFSDGDFSEGDCGINFEGTSIPIPNLYITALPNNQVYVSDTSHLDQNITDAQETLDDFSLELARERAKLIYTSLFSAKLADRDVKITCSNRTPGWIIGIELL